MMARGGWEWSRVGERRGREGGRERERRGENGRQWKTVEEAREENYDLSRLDTSAERGYDQHLAPWTLPLKHGGASHGCCSRFRFRLPVLRSPQSGLCFRLPVLRSPQSGLCFRLPVLRSPQSGLCFR